LQHYLLIYHLAEDYLERRAAYRTDHLTLAWQAADRGDLLLGGALEHPTNMALLLFCGNTPEAAEAFAQSDPYVVHGLVERWEVRKWNTVAGAASAAPLRPD
jgi:uncharacterized protein YciI